MFGHDNIASAHHADLICLPSLMMLNDGAIKDAALSYARSCFILNVTALTTHCPSPLIIGVVRYWYHLPDKSSVVDRCVAFSYYRYLEYRRGLILYQ
jgi:hypothetical protein